MRSGEVFCDDGDGVGQHVLVAVDRVLFEAQGGQLREELAGEAGRGQEPQSRSGIGHHHQLVEFVADAFGRDDLEPRRAVGSTAATRSSSGTRP